MGTDINLAMAIEKFSVKKENSDGSGDLYFTLELEEYRFLNVDKVGNTNKVNSFTGLRERP